MKELKDIKKLGLKYGVIAARIGMGEQLFSRKLHGAPNNGSTYKFTEAEQDAIRAVIDSLGQELKDFSQVLEF